MSERTDDYDYGLPEELIATRPPERRDAARMMVLDRKAGTWEHRTFAEFPGRVPRGALVVLNDTKVFKARVLSDDGRAEMLFLEAAGPREWIALVKPGRRLRVGDTCRVGGAEVRVAEVLEGGERRLLLEREIDFEAHGRVPLPPYLRRESEAADDERYQTVYAREAGSVAAPTAGLHFTPDVLARVRHAFVTLHVGTGTFQPVRAERVADHRMHEERFAISAGAAEAIAGAESLLCVGTTVTRVLESLPEGPVRACSGRTDIFIRPPFAFRRTSALLTNFHLPRSTLLMLVSAYAGREFVLEAYREAVRERYRFFSYGDCMLIL